MCNRDVLLASRSPSALPDAWLKRHHTWGLSEGSVPHPKWPLATSLHDLGEQGQGLRPMPPAPGRPKAEFCPSQFATAPSRKPLPQRGSSYFDHLLAGIAQVEDKGYQVCQDSLPHLSFVPDIHPRQQLPEQADSQRTLRLSFLDRRRRWWAFLKK